MTIKQRRMLIRILTAAVLTIVCTFLPVTGLWRLALYLIPYLIIGYDILMKAGMGLFHRRLFDENFLMAVATVGALVLAATRTDEYTEAVAVMLFYQLGEWFQSYAVGKSRRHIGELMNIRPDTANVETDGDWEAVDPDEVGIGTRIAVFPGERVPIVGIVESGESSLDTAALTGESLPRDVTVGDEVLSGSVNLSGMLILRTTKEFGESTVSRILDMVENASSRKARSERFISRFARVYTPIVCLSALALATLPPLALWIGGREPLFSEWVYRALTFLVISCPCALVVSVPLTYFAAIGGAGKLGILVKGSNYLETLAAARTVMWDKTGTLTRGHFEAEAVCAVDGDEDTLLRLAAHAEQISSHPVARSVVQAYSKPLEETVSDATELSGRGVIATVGGVQVAVGNGRLLTEQGIALPAALPDGTAVLVAADGQYRGYITIRDTVKPTAAHAIRALTRIGVSDTVLLTGDSEAVAKAVATELGIPRVHAGLLPADKVERVERALRDDGAVVFVGDGINDAPVLSRADVGIAMGGIGSDAAIEAADLVLMDDDPQSVVRAIRLSKKARRIVTQNIVFALGIKGICLLLGACGIANLWLAVFADVGVMVLAILNAVRALSVKRI